MIGAIIGDIIGSVYEWDNYKGTDFPLFSDSSHFTDDTVMTVAVSDALLSMEDKDIDDDEKVIKGIRDSLIVYGRSFPNVGYGSNFRKWIFSDEHEPYGSYGNGSAMRVSAVPYFAMDFNDALRLAGLSAGVTHDHSEGIKGAQAVAGCIWLALKGWDKEAIRAFVEMDYYDLGFNLDDIRADYSFDVSCQGSVPQGIKAFLEGESFEDCIRLAVSIGGDSDTIAAVTGGIAGAFYEIPEEIFKEAYKRLDPWLRAVVDKFYKKVSI